MTQISSEWDIESVLRAYAESINRKDFDTLASCCDFPVLSHGKHETREEHIAHFELITGPFMHYTNEVDHVIIDRSNASRPLRLAARLIFTVRPNEQACGFYGIDPKCAGREAMADEKLIAKFVADKMGKPKIKEVYLVPDITRVKEMMENPVKKQPELSLAAAFSSKKSSTKDYDIEGRWREFISSVISKTTDINAVSKFMHDDITINGIKGTQQDVLTHILFLLDICGNIEGEIHTVVVNKEKQQVAVWFVAHTVLTKPFIGLEPSGKKVAVPEIAFYQFEEGRVRAYYNALDFGTLRAQMMAS